MIKKNRTTKKPKTAARRKAALSLWLLLDFDAGRNGEGDIVMGALYVFAESCHDAAAVKAPSQHPDVRVVLDEKGVQRLHKLLSPKELEATMLLRTKGGG